MGGPAGRLQSRLQSLPTQDALEITGTFKLVKSRLVREGFNVSVVADPLFVLDNQAQAFRPLTPDIYRAVCEGAWRLRPPISSQDIRRRSTQRCSPLPLSPHPLPKPDEPGLIPSFTGWGDPGPHQSENKPGCVHGCLCRWGTSQRCEVPLRGSPVWTRPGECWSQRHSRRRQHSESACGLCRGWAGLQTRMWSGECGEKRREGRSDKGQRRGFWRMEAMVSWG